MNLNPKICVVIPCYKVKNKILDVINRIDKSLVDKIVIVDDACPENTAEFISNKITNNKIHLIKNKKNLGVGGATLKGFKYSLENNFDIVIKIDGDGQHKPEDLKKFINILYNKEYNFCKGTRFNSKENIKKIPFIRLVGNLILTELTKINCKNSNITDTLNGYLAIKTDILKKIDFEKISKDFFFEEDLLFHLSKTNSLTIKEVPIETIYYGKSNLNPAKTILPFLLKHFKNFLIR